MYTLIKLPREGFVENSYWSQSAVSSENSKWAVLFWKKCY